MATKCDTCMYGDSIRNESSTKVCAGCLAFNMYEPLQEMVSPDSNVEVIRQKLLKRSEVGLKKYGVTTERDNLDLALGIRLQEELLDGAVYIEAALRKLK